MKKLFIWLGIGGAVLLAVLVVGPARIVGKVRDLISAPPKVPTTAEDALPGFEYVGWFALMAPAGTPKAIVDRLYEDTRQAVVQPGMKRYLEEQGMTPAINAPGTLKTDIAKESVRWKALVAKKSITAN